MVTFAEAREAVAAVMARGWDTGTLHVSRAGYEDASSFLVVYGAREALEDGDPAFLLVGAPAAFVDKATGVVSLVDRLSASARIDKMTPVSSA